MEELSLAFAKTLLYRNTIQIHHRLGKTGHYITTQSVAVRIPLSFGELPIAFYQTQLESISDSDTSGKLATKARRLFRLSELARLDRAAENFRIELLETRLTVMSVQSVIWKEAFPIREC